jgi:hypothetical protein
MCVCVCVCVCVYIYIYIYIYIKSPHLKENPTLHHYKIKWFIMFKVIIVFILVIIRNP